MKKGKVEGDPLVFPLSSEITVRDFAESLDKRIAKQYNRANIINESSNNPSCSVGMDYSLNDGDQVEMIR